jgi:DNA-binding NtrC family response regulator
MSTAIENPAILKDARLLIADDEFMIAADLEFVFRNAGANVHMASTLDEALQAANAGELDGALLDVRLGTASSLGVAEALAQRKIPFLFFSGQILPPEISKRFPQAPALVKPVDYGKLLDVTAQMLD